MALKAYTFPGLPKPVYLPEEIPVEIKIISANVPGWTAGQYVPPSNFTSTTWHDTGNASSGANGEYNWAATGGRADINSPGSYNGIFDGSKIIICQRFDELVGHAAVHQGNITSYGFEQAGWGPGFDFNKCLQVGIYLHAGVLHAIGRTARDAMFQHNYWSGKDCPGEIRRRGLWAEVERRVDEQIARIKAHVSGGTPAPAPTPVPALKRTFTVRFDLYARYMPGFWDKDNNKSTVIKTKGGADVMVKAGTTGEIIEGPVMVDDVRYYNIKVAGQGLDGTAWVQDQVLHTLDIKAA